jgi:TolA-binding protein
MRVAAPLLLALVLAAAPAAAQVETREGIALQNQILQLRQEIEMLRRQGVGAGAPVARPSAPATQGELTAQLLDRISRLEEEVRALRGRAETAEFQLRQAREAIEKLEGDMEFRFRQLPGGGGAARPPASAPQPPAQPQRPAQPAAARTPAQALTQGQQALAQRDFAAAEAAAREVIAANDRPRLVDANILLGQALAGRNRHQDAAIAFGDAYRLNQRGPRAPEALIGFASSLTALGARQDACNALAQLASDFPNLPAPRQREAEAVRARARC